MSWKRYEKYQDSGVEWLGEIPEGWGVKPLKYLSKEPLKYGANESAEDEDPQSPRFIRITDINSDGTLKKDTYKSLPETIARDFMLQDDDILFARSGATVGKTFIYSNSWGRCCFAGYLVRFRSNREQIDPKYLSYYSNSISYWDWISSVNIQSTIQNVSGEKYANHTIPLPPLPEQTAIAAFLDRETARIDALIEKKERLIALLEEKRAGLISHAVTKGLDPSVPMKDSGMEWIGMVPAGWKIIQLRRVISKFVDYRGKTPEKVESGRMLVTARNIKNGKIDFSLSEEFMKEEDYAAWMVRGFPEIGDVLITTEAPLGEIAQVNDIDIALAQRIILLKTNKTIILDDYLKYLLISDSGKGELWSRATGSTAVGIKAEHLRSVIVTVPQLNEQREIVHYIKTEVTKLEKPVNNILKSINILREYRSALISAAVTGKIDLRHEAIG